MCVMTLQEVDIRFGGNMRGRSVTTQTPVLSPMYLYRHTATIPLGGLPPDTVVEYRYGSDAAGWSEQRQFHVAPAPGIRPGEPPVR